MGNVIKSVGDFLLELKNKGVEDIKPYLDIGHNPTIGDMYEGLTKSIIEKAVFKEMNLRVVSGKIVNSDGLYSNQIDCMVVVSDGEKVPYTSEFVYSINQVIMVIEVKKNLFTKEMTEGYKNLQSVIKTQHNDYRELSIEAIKDAYESITKTSFPGIKNISIADADNQMLYHSLVVEALLPIRVIFGYDGFKSELTLRKKFIDYLSKNVKYKDFDETNNDNRETDSRGIGFGITSLPNLIVCGNNSIIKTNGMPYSMNVETDSGFIWMASYRKNPIVLLLELLWTRLTYHYGLSPSIFGDELYDEGLAPLLSAKLFKESGWQYSFFEYSQEEINYIDTSYDNAWQPYKITKEEFFILNLLCNTAEYKVDLLKDQFEDEEKIIRNLIDKGLIFIEGDKIKLLTKNCKCLIDPEMGYLAADDYDGRLTNWLKHRMEKKRLF